MASSTWSSCPAITTTRSSGRSPVSGTSGSAVITDTVTEPEPNEYELYDLTVDPIEAHNLAHPSHADDRSRALQHRMLGLLIDQLDAKRLTPSTGEVRGYRAPDVSVTPR